MPSVATVLKQEITRLSRKEAKAQNAAARKAIAQYRHDIAELKRQVRTLTSQVTELRRQHARTAKAPTAGSSSPVRFSPSWVRRHRERLELSAADYAALVGVSPLTIYNWEKGKTRPRAEQLTAWGRIRGLGKREAWKRLEAMEA